jgi:YbgC/YbaW family acyl-CoA thioester hydrolase
VHSLQINYKKPAKLDECLTIEAHVMQLRRTSIIFRQNIYRGSELLSQAEVKIACVDKLLQKPCAIPTAIYNALNADIAAQIQ